MKAPPALRPGGKGCGLCLSLSGPSLREAAQASAACRGRVDLVELRADLLPPGELGELARFPALSPVPAILVLRRRRDGGGFAAPEGQRRAVLRRALEGGWAAVELEEDLRDGELEAAARRGGRLVIRCLHDTGGVPADLAERLRGLPRAPGEIAKALVSPSGTQDLVRLAPAFRELESRPGVIVAQGERGLYTRVLAPRLGCRLAYCSSAELERFLGSYRFRSLDAGTMVCGVIGNPIAHSRSPELHNRGYAALGLNAVYLPFLVDRVEAFFELAETLRLSGFSVTMPFKEQVIPLLSERDPAVLATGACNTVLRRGPRRWCGANTDVAGFLGPLRSRAPACLDPSTRAVVIGAGGAARAVLYALRQQGMRPRVLNRTVARARRLGESFGCPWGPLSAEGLAEAGEGPELIVQTTSAGMGAARDVDPLPGYGFSGEEVVYELVYEPPLTPLLARAAAAGCTTVGGAEMLAAQGREQFRLFTGRDYPDSPS